MRFIFSFICNMFEYLFRLGDTLNQMMPLLRTMDWWAEAEKYFRMMNVMAAVGANRTTDLPGIMLLLISG